MNIADRLTRATDSATSRPIIATLAAPGKTIGASSITLSAATNWTTSTPVYIAIYTVTAAGIKDPTSQTDWKATLSGSTLSNLTLTGGTDRTYAAGAYVEITYTAAWAKDLYDALAASHNADGSLKTTAVNTALGLTSAPAGGWDILNGGVAPTTTSGYNKGNKEFALTFAGVDLTSTLSAGMRLKFDRATTAPTQCMSFTAASSQYATKASPTGITFTSAFTCEAWVYLNSYAAEGIISRDDGTNGWSFEVNSSGQLEGFFRSGSGTAIANSYQSIPLKRWVHVAMVVTVATTTFTFYINGVSAPLTKSGTITTLAQGTAALMVGKIGSNASSYFDGQISEARVWSVAQITTQIQDNMAISLTGSETNLVALFQGNGNFTDKTANGNTLTATGGAIATYSDNPYHTTEYAIITKNPTYATSNTTVTVFTGTDYVLPNATLTNPYSSYQKTPFGFPVGRDKWTLEVLNLADVNNGAGTSGTVYNVGSFQISVPTGSWIIGGTICARMDFGSAGINGVVVALDTSTGSQNDKELRVRSDVNSTTVGTAATLGVAKSLSAQTVYYCNIGPIGTSSSTYLFGSSGQSKLTAESAYI